jgi:hypothetical protein
LPVSPITWARLAMPSANASGKSEARFASSRRSPSAVKPSSTARFFSFQLAVSASIEIRPGRASRNWRNATGSTIDSK